MDVLVKLSNLVDLEIYYDDSVASFDSRIGLLSKLADLELDGLTLPRGTTIATEVGEREKNKHSVKMN